MSSKQNIRIILFLALLLSSLISSAQAPLIQTALLKLERASNFSYQYTLKLRQYNTDTVTSSYKHSLRRDPNDKTVGYRYRLESRNKSDNSHSLEAYNGTQLIRLNLRDSTYQTTMANSSSLQGTLLGYLRMLKNLSDKKPVRNIKDTTINAVNYARCMISSYDTLINQEHYYTHINLSFDKNTGLPAAITTVSRNRNTADAVTNYYSSFEYSDYHFNLQEGDSSFSADTTGFRLPVERPTLPLLSPGSNAPDWTLSDTNNQALSLSKFKGKVVLLNFFFIGCEGGMVSLKPLNNLYHKYKGKSFTLISISDRDSRKMIEDFKKSYQIPFQMRGEARDTFEAYHVSVSPTFYIIGKDGKIAKVQEGYNDSFESKAMQTIDSLLQK